MSEQIQSNANTKRTFWAVALFYMLIAFEFFYMASPFAFYFYSVYGPALNFIYINTPQLAARVKRKGQIRIDIVAG